MSKVSAQRGRNKIQIHRVGIKLLPIPVSVRGSSPFSYWFSALKKTREHTTRCQGSILFDFIGFHRQEVMQIGPTTFSWIPHPLETFQIVRDDFQIWRKISGKELMNFIRPWFWCSIWNRRFLDGIINGCFLPPVKIILEFPIRYFNLVFLSEYFSFTYRRYLNHFSY